jgi:hypothetical protein
VDWHWDDAGFGTSCKAEMATDNCAYLAALLDGTPAIADRPRKTNLALLKGRNHIDLGRTQEAEVVAKQVDALLAQGRLHSEYRYILDGLNLDSGASLHELAMWARNPNPMVEYLGVHKWLMQHGHAQDVIEILDRRTRKGAIPYDYLRLAPWLASLQNDPRFQSVLKRARGQFEEMLSVLDEARARGEFPQYLETPLAEMRRQLQ